MSILRRATAMKTALNFICREVYPSSSSSGFRNIRVLGGVSIPRPPPSKPHVFFRAFLTQRARSRDRHPSEDWSDKSFKEYLLEDGCDFEHWFIAFDPPEGNPSRDEIIDMYIKTLAAVVGSEEEARKKIYSVSTKHYYAYGCQISEETANKLESIPLVRWILPDSYFDPKTKSYGGEPFINGQAVPYDPKYHEVWVRNNARVNERRERDRNRNSDRSRNFERRREMRQNDSYQSPPPNSNYRAPQGNTRGEAPDSQGRSPPNSTYQA